MQKWIGFIGIILLSSCAKRPLYTKDKFFDCNNQNYTNDSDLKEVIRESLKRAFVIEKDIQDYQFIWDKSKLYVLNEYHIKASDFDILDIHEFNQTKKFLNVEVIPPNIGHVKFCAKSYAELQEIANKAKEDFDYVSFSVIDISQDEAIVTVNNTRILNQKSKKNKNITLLYGGGYTCKLHKVNGKWQFEKIISTWVS